MAAVPSTPPQRGLKETIWGADEWRLHIQLLYEQKQRIMSSDCKVQVSWNHLQPLLHKHISFISAKCVFESRAHTKVTQCAQRVSSGSVVLHESKQDFNPLWFSLFISCCRFNSFTFKYTPANSEHRERLNNQSCIWAKGAGWTIATYILEPLSNHSNHFIFRWLTNHQFKRMWQPTIFHHSLSANSNSWAPQTD